MFEWRNVALFTLVLTNNCRILYLQIFEGEINQNKDKQKLMGRRISIHKTKVECIKISLHGINLFSNWKHVIFLIFPSLKSRYKLEKVPSLERKKHKKIKFGSKLSS